MGHDRASTLTRRRRNTRRGDVVQGIVVFNRGGLLVHADPSVAGFLACPPGPAIVRKLGAAARDLLADRSREHASEHTHPIGGGRDLRVRLLRSGAESACGLVALSSGPASDFEEVAQDAHLTAREVEVARRVVLGLEDDEISDALGISRQTVRWHVRNVLRKTSLQGRAALAELGY